MNKEDGVKFRLDDTLMAALRIMSATTATLRDSFPGEWGTTQDYTDSDFGMWTKVGSPDGHPEIHRFPSPKSIQEMSDMSLGELLEEGAKLLFPTADRIVDADVVLLREGKSCSFCIVGNMKTEDLELVCGHLLQRLRLLPQKPDAE